MSADRTRSIAIVGAGTMGSGIALAALYAGFEVQLQDVSEQVLERAQSYLREYLERKDQLDALARLSLHGAIGAMGPSELWLEAVPEDLDLKREIFGAMESAAPDAAILATNTSTLSVTAIAAAVERPGRVVGMHFFNPAAVLPLVEVVRAADSDEETVQRAVAVAEALGKTAVVVADSPGFIVNRVARPFYGEALRLLGEGAADVATIDAVVKGAGFPMGPFTLMDLIGIDVNLAAARSVYEQTFHEPRFRPHPIQQRMVAAGTLGRKTGRGFYHYDEKGERRESLSLEPGEAEGQGALAVVGGGWDLSAEEWLQRAGFELDAAPGAARAGFVFAARDEELPARLGALDRELPPERPLFCQLNDCSWSEAAGWVERPGRLVGFDALFFGQAQTTSVVGAEGLEDDVRQAAADVVRAAGRAPHWVQDRPGLILPRIVCALVNEAAFAVEETVAEAETVDRAMRLGVNYPQGPLEWGRELGWERVLAVLDHMQREYREPRYRAAPWLRRAARASAR